MPAPPHNELPNIELSIQKFTAIAQQFATTDDGSKFLPFVLAGRMLDDEDIDENGDDVLKRVFVNAVVDAECPLEDMLSLTRDYDSVIGISNDLPYTDALSIFPVPPFKETLKRDNHIKRQISRQDVSSSLSKVYQLTIVLFREPALLYHCAASRISHSARLAAGMSSEPFSPGCTHQATRTNPSRRSCSQSSMTNAFVLSFRR